ncbi:MAG: phospholipase D-like domain-containing protein [Polaromonas sp.]|uniref:phospholipase D-like domain-containing protein n=1 Tax=Polaromonas sp. TaxID=1869339 RepID=UPI002734BF68|nr:phospholipase D-like domain-containing protein [Polaromonas sp.]MDP2818704.1 phospholipase D-like domain-containing protein [Polaromonas sp.]
MKIVMGELNGVRLLDILQGAKGCSRVTAAVAYATAKNPFFEHCKANNIFLAFYGLLDEGEAVALPVLDQFLTDGPSSVNCRLIYGHFHSKIIWWHGYGAYVGSANLTSNAWFTNVECGVFYEESELLESTLGIYLEQQFDYLKANSTSLTKELLEAIRTASIENGKARIESLKRELKTNFRDALKGVKRHPGLTSKTKPDGFTKFVEEWSQTLELLRGLRKEFIGLNLRPEWVSDEANPTVHFDQFLHAYYYVKVRGRKDDDEEVGEESKKSVALVNSSYLKNRENSGRALIDAAKWWASLTKAPYGEDVFIKNLAPQMQSEFSEERLSRWTLEDFQAAFQNVHAFKAHARQVQNAKLGLPKGHTEPVGKRLDLVAKWLWEQEREESQHSIVELLRFLIWGKAPSNVAERLWIATTNPEWRFEHFGPSSLGEALGWARPDEYPPRNNRTNKALRSLGYDVRLFSS